MVWLDITILPKNKPLFYYSNMWKLVRAFNGLYVKILKGAKVVGILPIVDDEIGKKLIPISFPWLVPGKCEMGEGWLNKILNEQGMVDGSNLLCGIGGRG